VVLENEDGSQTCYELREMTAGDRDIYMDKMNARMEQTPDGTFRMKKYDGAQAELLCACMHMMPGGLVTKEQVQAWPATVVSALFSAAQALNKVGGEEPEKKA
jgi:hypothetical protein